MLVSLAVVVQRLSCSIAYGVLVPGPGMELILPAVEAGSLNHWTTREVPGMPLFLIKLAKPVPKHSWDRLLVWRGLRPPRPCPKAATAWPDDQHGALL